MSQIRACRSLTLSICNRINKKPLLRGWWYYDAAPNQPVNGEYDFNSGKGDYFFGKPYFVHQKAKDIYYEQIGWIHSDHDLLDIILLRDLVYQADLEGTEAAGQKGETITVPKDIGRHMIARCDGLYATPENAEFIAEELGDGEEMTQAQQAIKRELSWLELEDLSITFRSQSGWTVTPASVSRRILVSQNIVLPSEQISISEDSLIREGDVEPIGMLKINILLDDGLEPMQKDVVISAT